MTNKQKSAERKKLSLLGDLEILGVQRTLSPAARLREIRQTGEAIKEYLEKKKIKTLKKRKTS